MITSRSTRATAASSSSCRRSNRWKDELCKTSLLLFFFLFSFYLFLKSVSSAYGNRWKYDVFQIFGCLLLQNNNQITWESWERLVFFRLKRSGVSLLYLKSMITSRSTLATAASSSSSRRSNRWKYELCKNPPLLFFFLFLFSLFLKSVYTSSSANANRWKYDAFLNFRGDDTRTGFTDHLSIALRNADIDTFVDYQLRKGKMIQSELDREIERSRIAVVIFSKKYAESRWCLRELSKIMRCLEDQEGKVVYPIFYNVDPSEVRKQRGSFEEAFRKHEKEEDPNEVKQWRKDLKACADLVGRNLKTTADGREGLFIQNVVWDIIEITKTRDLQSCQALGWNTLLRLQQFTIIIIFFHFFFLKSVNTSSSAHANCWKYQVFLSFSGVDTRTGFTAHLFMALHSADINTFVDDQLEIGEHIQTGLDRAIEGSRIAVVVFSKSYAKSRWCLRELSKIMREGKVVYPIFYDIDPSQVRKQSGSFGEAFQKHKSYEDPNEVEQWRNDLVACANLSGRNLITTADRREESFIQNVAGDIIGLTKTGDLQTCQALGWNPMSRLQQFIIFILFFFLFIIEMPPALNCDCCP